MWKCIKCEEQIEERFDTCWRCGTTREGKEDPDFQPEEAAQGGDVEDNVREEPEPAAVAHDRTCLRCGSPDLIPNARILDYYDQGWSDDVHVEVYANPDAWFFTGATSSPLQAQVCGRCGHVELYVQNPETLLEAYRKSQEKGKG